MGRHIKPVKKTDEERFPVKMDNIEAIKECFNDMLNGATYSVMVNKLKSDAYGLGIKFGEYQAQNIIRQARKLIQDDFRDYISSAREQIWAAVMDLYTDSKIVGDRRNALDCLKYAGKLFGIEEAQKLDVSVQGDITIDFGLE